MWTVKRLKPNNILKQQSCYNETCGFSPTNDLETLYKDTVILSIVK